MIAPTSKTAKRCPRCPGSLLFDRIDREWRCLLCGRTPRPSAGTAAIVVREAYGRRT